MELFSKSEDLLIKDRMLKLNFINKRGTGILKKNSLGMSSDIETITDRVQIKRLVSGNMKLMIVNLYMNTNSSLTSEQRKFENLLSQASSTINCNRERDEEIIVSGDFNICFLSHTEKRRKKAMEKFVRDIGGTYYVSEHPTNKSKVHGSMSWLDAVIVTPGIVIETLLPLTDTQMPCSSSTHHPLLIKIQLGGTKPEKFKPSPYDGPILGYKRPDWENVHMGAFHTFSDHLIGVAEEILSDLSWEVQTKAYCDAVAMSIDLSTIIREKTS